MSSYSDEGIRQQVRICLMKIKKDDAFMESHLDASDYECINMNNKAGDEEKFNMFLKYVAMCLTSPKKAKKFVDQRLKKNHIVLEEIEKFDPDTYVLEEDPVKVSKSDLIKERQQNAKKTEAKKKKSKENNKMDVDTEEAPAAAVEQKSDKKRPRSKSTPKKESKSDSKTSRVSIQFSKKERKSFAKDAMMEYKAQKEETLEEVPEEYSKHWGKIVFGKWKKDPHRPVLLLGPYGVPPGPFRDMWQKMFKNTRGDTKRMWYYCFWFGSPLTEGYTQQKLKEFVPYENAVKRNIHILPEKIKDKVEKGKKLTKVEEQIIAGFKCLEDVLKQKPEDRRGEEFEELHESLLNLDDNISLTEDVMEDDGLEELESDDEEEEEEEEVKTPPAKKAKIAAKKTAKPAIKKKAKKKAEPLVDDFINDIGEPELSHDDSESNDDKDDDFDKEEVENDRDDDDDKDLDFEEERPSKPKSSKKKKPPAVAKEIAPKPKKEKVVKLEKEPRDPEHEERLAKRRERDRLRVNKKKEAKAYEQCVLNFKSVVTTLQGATDSKDTQEMVECMKKIKVNVKDFSAPFIEEFKLAPLIKSAKTIFTESEDKEVRKALWEELKVIYNEKRALVPDGWRLFLSSEHMPKEEKSETSDVKGKSRKKKLESSQDPDSGSHQNGTSEDLKKKHVSEKESNLDSSRNPENRQSIDGNEMPSKRKREDASAARGRSKQRVEASTSLTLPRKSELKREESSGANSANKQRSDSPFPPPSVKTPKRKTSLPSLKSLLSKDSKNTKIKKEDTSSARKSLEPVVVVKKLPEWLTKELSLDPDIESYEGRSLGLEFFLEASASFPGSVNTVGLARALESAAFAWAMEHKAKEESWEEKYWGKVHMVVGTIADKDRPGSLVAAIVDGKHQSARSVVDLSEDELLALFEGGKNGYH